MTLSLTDRIWNGVGIDPIYKKLFWNRKAPPAENFVLPTYVRDRFIENLPEAKIEVFRRMFAFENRSHLPITWPFTLAWLEHLKIFSREDFPLPVFGLIHLNNSIHQTRPIPVAAQVKLVCTLADAAITHRGYEFAALSKIYWDGDLVWQCRSGLLYRRKDPLLAPPTTRREKGSSVRPDVSESWDIPENMGRRYARVSGDYNPIHLHRLTAKFFGFRQPIIHGMWALSQCAARLEKISPRGESPLTLECSFKTPIFMPATVNFHCQEEQDGLYFGVYDKDSVKPHVLGKLKGQA